MKIRPEAKAAADRIRAEYQIRDAGGLELLAVFAAAYTSELEAAAQVAEHGVVVIDRFGQPKSNPASAVLRDARSQKMQALKLLQLPIDSEE
ncbi:P27 family phage terminase small subunit [Desulfurivibrio sp. D14AmB]|uniref:P27 family phage terminase small subunit n=1 Tax=Desulfurivibrio sp. D14AmB TaxID=3374370 RepID=UPI00376ED540